MEIFYAVTKKEGLQVSFSCCREFLPSSGRLWIGEAFLKSYIKTRLGKILNGTLAVLCNIRINFNATKVLNIYAFAI